MKNYSKNLLIILLIIFIIFDIQPPAFFTNMFNHVFGKIILFALSISLFNYGPLVGSLALVSSYLLLVRSYKLVSLDEKTYIPSEEKKAVYFSENLNNKFPKTLEEEAITHDVPLIKDIPVIESSFVPVMNYTHDALTV